VWVGRGIYKVVGVVDCGLEVTRKITGILGLLACAGSDTLNTLLSAACFG
jgi:hypothetical protein